jgi:hypothetical protein
VNNVHIWSGEHRCYWRADKRGYTKDVTEAGEYTRDEATKILAGVGPEKKLELREIAVKPEPVQQPDELPEVVSHELAASLLDELPRRIMRGDAIRQVAALRRYIAQQKVESALIDALAHSYWQLEPFDMPTGAGDADVGWRVRGFYMRKPEERIIGEVFKDDPRAAIRAAVARSMSKDPELAA